MSPDVLIVGGGVAGLSAAVDLTAHGYSVLLIERKKYLGGRTYSFVDEATGDNVDNGQHLMMGCYDATLRYLSAIGSLSKVSFQKNLSITFRQKGRTPARLHALSLPAPFHILAGLLRLRSMAFPHRLALVRVGIALLNSDTNERLKRMTVDKWLTSLHQPEENKKYLWDIIAIGALNDSPSKISAAIFANVLRSAFFGKRSNSSMVVPREGLSSVLVDPAVEYIERHGGKILRERTVRRIECESGTIEKIILDSGTSLKPKAVICAVPYFNVAQSFSSSFRLNVPHLQSADHFQSSPIVTIHLWFNRHFMEEEFIALLDSPIHWIFNKSKMYEQTNPDRMYLSLVISGATEIAGMSKERIISLALQELHTFYPSSHEAAVIHSLVLKEKRATFSPTVDVQRHRPPTITGVRNFFLAGDWTDTNLPATIEGAIQSGYKSSTAVRSFLAEQ